MVAQAQDRGINGYLTDPSIDDLGGGNVPRPLAQLLDSAFRLGDHQGGCARRIDLHFLPRALHLPWIRVDVRSETPVDEFDVVVIGSGFGGAVTAERIAAAGFSVCVLERGRPYPPNSFARSPYSMNRAFWDPANGRTGLFDVWSFRRMSGVVSAGLGGGSLIYANVLIRKDEHWFDNASQVEALGPGR